ncbi:uncharacterized protein LOC126681353 [Mercurialis annua]|uniref:uncharacterized protein LOC126681353 n=1 Tax=Mercurialis annua TaxID=3986 RepID=UPI0024AE2C39|nr:uncharacterized protein LOC126681353 [Mercurialis annua]
MRTESIRKLAVLRAMASLSSGGGRGEASTSTSDNAIRQGSGRGRGQAVSRGRGRGRCQGRGRGRRPTIGRGIFIDDDGAATLNPGSALACPLFGPYGSAVTNPAFGQTTRTTTQSARQSLQRKEKGKAHVKIAHVQK